MTSEILLVLLLMTSIMFLSYTNRQVEVRAPLKPGMIIWSQLMGIIIMDLFWIALFDLLF